MKKALTLVLAVLLLIGLLPMTVMAEEAAPLSTDQAQVQIYYGEKQKFDLTLSADTGAAYITVNESGIPAKWEGAEAPADKFVKFEYVAGEPATVKATFQNYNVDLTEFITKGYVYYAFNFLASDTLYNVEIELIGENSITQSAPACIANSSQGTMTITGPGSLSLKSTGFTNGCIQGYGGDLIIKDTTLNLQVELPEGTNAKHHGIYMNIGSVIMEGAKITSKTRGGSVVWLGDATAKTPRATVTTDTERKIILKNCEISAESHSGTHFVSASPAEVSGCTITMKKTATGKAMFDPAPNFVGDYTAVGGLLKNADNPEKLKPYKPSQMSSYGFMSVVPYIVETEAPTTEATEPETEPTTEATQPVDATLPTTEATQPETQAPTTEATQPVDTDGESSGSPLKVVVIIIVVLVVLAGAAVAALFILKKKGIIK